MSVCIGCEPGLQLKETQRNSNPKLFLHGAFQLRIPCCGFLFRRHEMAADRGYCFDIELRDLNRVVSRSLGTIEEDIFL